MASLRSPQICTVVEPKTSQRSSYLYIVRFAPLSLRWICRWPFFKDIPRFNPDTVLLKAVYTTETIPFRWSCLMPSSNQITNSLDTTTIPVTKWSISNAVPNSDQSHYGILVKFLESRRIHLVLSLVALVLPYVLFHVLCCTNLHVLRTRYLQYAPSVSQRLEYSWFNLIIPILPSALHCCDHYCSTVSHESMAHFRIKEMTCLHPTTWRALV